MHPIVTFNSRPPTGNSKGVSQKNIVQVRQNVAPIAMVPGGSPAKFVGTYVIDYTRELGHGNFSKVYLAIDKRQPNIKMAVKVVNLDRLR